MPRRVGAERGRVTEAHLDRLRARPSPGPFVLRDEAQSLVGLDLEGERVGGEVEERRFAGEQRARRPAEVDGDFGDAARHAFARAEVEGHALPAPVVDRQAQRGVGPRCGVRRRCRPPRRSPAPALPPTMPPAYCARVTSPAGPMVRGWMALRTLTFSSRMASASSEPGGSIAVSASSCIV